MGYRTILSQTNFIKQGHYGVHVSNLKHHLTEYSKTCGKCNQKRFSTYRQSLHSNLTNVPTYQHISCDILGPVYIKTANNSKRKVYILFIIDVNFYATTYFLLDSIKAFDIKLALKTLEIQFGEIKFFSSDSGSQLRESKLNTKDAQGNFFFNWTTSLRTGPQNQRHKLI